jgi:hypothetical protein
VVRGREPGGRVDRAEYAAQYFVDDVRLRQTLVLDIGNTRGRILRYEDGGTNAQPISGEYGP